MSTKDRATVGRAVRAFWPYIRQDRLRFISLVATSLLGGLVEAFILVLVTNLALSLDEADTSVSAKAGVLQLRITPTVAFIVAVMAIVTRTGLGIANGWSAAELATRASSRLRRSLNSAYLRAAWDYQARQPEGSLQDLLGTYTSQVTSGLASLANLSVSTSSLLMMVTSSVIVSPIAAIGLGVGAAALSLIQRPLRTTVKHRAGALNQANTALGLSVTETAQLMQEIRTAGVTGPVERRLSSLVERSRAADNRLRTLMAASIFAYQGAALLLVVLALWAIYLAGLSNVTALAAVVLILVRSLSYAQQVQSQSQALQANTPAAERVRDQLAELRAHSTPEGGTRIENIGDLGLDDVSFRYNGDHLALRHVTATITHGEAIGLVGPSGAGKSTLVQVLLRLRVPTSGRLSVSGVDATKICTEDYYQRVAFVPQDNRLFNGTVLDNIAFYRDVTYDQICRAARLAHIHNEIMEWPDGYETLVGVRGSAISGGQRQRICLARALLTNPDVLVLDEPTSALDLHSEALIHHTLAELRGHTTMIIVSHRLSTLRVCDRIMVLNDGHLEAYAPARQLEQDNAFFATSLALNTGDPMTTPDIQ